MKQPWLKFYPADWRADPALRMCSLAARGLWMDMLCIMHDAEPYGSLVVNGSSLTDQQLARLCGQPLREVQKALADLEEAGVFSREDNGTENSTIYSRRMRRDREKAETDKANGKRGGNPKLKGGVNPPDKAQKPEARSQKLEAEKQDAAAAGGEPPSAESELFKRGKAVLGQNAGGQISKLLKAKGSAALARAAIETASTKENPREYVAAILRGNHDPPAHSGGGII